MRRLVTCFGCGPSPRSFPISGFPIIWPLVLLGCCGTAPRSSAQPPAAADSPAPSSAAIAFFESKVRPVLIEHCYDCHSEQAGAAEGDLRVDSRQAIRRGGQRGPAVVPGDAQGSLLITALTHADPDLRMPPKSPPLPEQVIADLKRWVEMGAPDPRDAAPSDAATTTGAAHAAEHWAYQPLRSAPPPLLENPLEFAEPAAAWPRRELDRFILAELHAQGLTPSPDAPPRVLLRRLHFDLIGLPPAPVDLQRFERRIAAEGIDAALRAEVDRLLASPQFGERWGRHWLDVARFGESSGKEANISFPYAWRYRDYVIDAFNEDLPYDRFLHEQIAGDLLPAGNEAERARLLIATGFLALGPKNLDEANALQFLADLIDEQIDSVSRAVLASSIACARCHDHKFDPFSMRDYYALAGIFASTETFFGTAISPANRVGGKPLPLPQGAGQAVLHESIPAAKVAELKTELATLQQREAEGRQAVRQAIAAGKDPSGLFTLQEALGIFWRSGAINGQLQKVSSGGQALPLAMGVLDRPQVFDVPLLQRGEINRPGAVVPRGLPTLPQFTPPVSMPQQQSGRLELAQWLTHRQHPLTARVMVNRVWHHLFGAGLVSTVDDFGTTGQPPSHPQLLDHLANRFLQNGWSVKQLVRELVLSRTYRQGSDHNEQAFVHDPDNRLLWRAAKRRLSAEEIRDAMLVVSGELDARRPLGSLVGRVIGDRPISLIGLDRRLPSDLDGAVHRAVYLPVIRDRLPDVLDLFDFAEPSLVTGQRDTTTVATQALYLMNSPFVQDRAAALAARLQHHAASDLQRIQLAFQWCYNRLPDPEEQQRCLTFLAAATACAPPVQELLGQELLGQELLGQELVEQEPPVDAPHTAGPPRPWISLCHALLATAEFRYLD